MKKFIMLTIVFSICIFPFSNAYAAPTAYAVNEENMTVTIPMGWDVFTQATDVNDKRLSKYGMDSRLLDTMRTSNTSLVAACGKLMSVSGQPLTEIDVTWEKDDLSEEIYNLKRVNDSNVETLAKSITNMLKKTKDAKIGDYITYSNDKTKYIVTNYSYLEKGCNLYSIKYYTIVNGQMICISLYSYNVPIPDKMTDVIKTIADSFTYIEKPNPKAKPSDTAGFILIVLGGGVALALTITGIVIFIKKKGRAQYGSREIVISDGCNTDTPESSGRFIPPEPTDRNGTRDTDNTGEGQAAQPEVTQETEVGHQEYQPEETNKPDAMGEAGQTKEAALFCNQCGAKVPENSRFCYRCGAPVYRD